MTDQASDRPTTINRHPTTPMHRRFLAILYDSVLLAAVLFCVSMLYFAVAATLHDHPIPPGAELETGTILTDVEPVPPGPFFIPLLTAVSATFFIYFWRQTGETLGMRAWKLKLVSEDFSRPSIGQCSARLVLASLSLLLLGFGYWYIWLNAERHSLHGRLSRTRVIWRNN